MGQVILNAMQWSSLEHIDNVRPIDESDATCLEEIRLVLAKYENLDRFGIALLHSHFQLADDELMVETTNVEQREHWVRPIKKSSLEQAGLEPQTTILRFDESGAHRWCTCAKDNNGHTGAHGTF